MRKLEPLRNTWYNHTKCKCLQWIAKANAHINNCEVVPLANFFRINRLGNSHDVCFTSRNPQRISCQQSESSQYLNSVNLVCVCFAQASQEIGFWRKSSNVVMGKPEKFKNRISFRSWLIEIAGTSQYEIWWPYQLFAASAIDPVTLLWNISMVIKGDPNMRVWIQLPSSPICILKSSQSALWSCIDRPSDFSLSRANIRLSLLKQNGALKSIKHWVILFVEFT